MPPRLITDRVAAQTAKSDFDEADDLMKKIGLSMKELSVLKRRILGVEGDPMVRGLTEREMEVFALMGRCLSNRTIAEKLGISPKTLDIHRNNLSRKLGVTSPGIVRAWLVWCLTGKGE